MYDTFCGRGLENVARGRPALPSSPISSFSWLCVLLVVSWSTCSNATHRGSWRLSSSIFSSTPGERIVTSNRDRQCLWEGVFYGHLSSTCWMCHVVSGVSFPQPQQMDEDSDRCAINAPRMRFAPLLFYECFRSVCVTQRRLLSDKRSDEDWGNRFNLIRICDEI